MSRSRLRGWDHLLHVLALGMRPYRCLDCWNRFWAMPRGHRGRRTTGELASEGSGPWPNPRSSQSFHPSS